MLNYKKPAFWIIVVAIVASIVTAVCFLTNPVDKKPDDTTQQTEPSTSIENTENTQAAETVYSLENTTWNTDFTFYCYSYGANSAKSMSVAEFLAERNAYVYSFALFDLDADGTEEFICRLATGNDIYYGYIVFHIIDGDIYGYEFSWRGFRDLKTDGTVDYAESGFDFGFRKLVFTKEGYSETSATYCQSIREDHEIVGSNYFVNDKPATKEAFDKASAEREHLAYVPFEHNPKNKGFFQYFDFLAGQVKCLDREGKEIDFKSHVAHWISGVLRQYYYGFYDMNGDNKPELCVKKLGVYAFFTIKDGRVTQWSQVRSSYTYPLENGALLHERHGGGPAHINYEYYELNFDGEVVKTTAFDLWWPNDSEQGDPKTYFFNYKEVTAAEYNALTAPYLAHKEAPIHWFAYVEGGANVLYAQDKNFTVYTNEQKSVWRYAVYSNTGDLMDGETLWGETSFDSLKFENKFLVLTRDRGAAKRFYNVENGEVSKYHTLPAAVGDRLIAKCTFEVNTPVLVVRNIFDSDTPYYKEIRRDFGGAVYKDHTFFSGEFLENDTKLRITYPVGSNGQTVTEIIDLA